MSNKWLTKMNCWDGFDGALQLMGCSAQPPPPPAQIFLKLQREVILDFSGLGPRLEEKALEAFSMAQKLKLFSLVYLPQEKIRKRCFKPRIRIAFGILGFEGERSSDPFPLRILARAENKAKSFANGFIGRISRHGRPALLLFRIRHVTDDSVLASNNHVLATTSMCSNRQPVW